MITPHTYVKYERILLLNDANMIGEHWDTRMKMPNMFGPKKFQIPCSESKVPNWRFLIWHF